MSDPGSVAPALPPPALPATEASTPPPPRLRSLLGDAAVDVALALLVMFAASLLAGVAWGVWRAVAAVAANGGEAIDPSRLGEVIGEPGALAQMLMAIVSMATPALLLYFWRRRAGRGERSRSRAALRRPATWGWALLVAALVFAGTTLASWLMQLAGSEPVPTNLAMVEEASRRWPWFLFLFAVGLAPAYEELLFRRVLFGRFLAAGRPWLGMAVSSLAFALMHEVPGISANPPLAVVQLLAVYAGMGAAFAWVYRRTGTLWAPILAHGLNNAVALLAHGLA
ncbi:CPBP family intramembrane glutamic endopeptidase [Pseudoxanthomonas sp.]|uniref:CPBP family intramembrane glutamic endopeptidase n=1 Tax=Pseudoxanthomonas sp. TaxID=1871049 RepID=UPI00258ED1BF|nr:CPBP family intramembrane glutamic endopeptidase [Pseudoxanthomonas sp.]MCR6686124.1 CPBP family intramembrane metalloprotease [Pseudoxanthomonas sp.]